MLPFVHLRMHSEFSIVDSIAKLDGAVAKAKADGQTAQGLTDLGGACLDHRRQHR